VALVYLPMQIENGLFDWVERTTRRVLGLRPQLTPQLAQRTTSITRSYPWMAPGVVSSLAVANLAPEHPAVRRAAILAAKQNDFAPVGAPVRTPARSRQPADEAGAMRASGLVADPAAIGSGLKNIMYTTAAAGQELSRLVTGQGPASELRIAVRRELTGQPYDYDSVRAEYEEQRARQPLPGLTPDQVKALGPGGNWASPGRLFARHITEPGRTPFKVVSGLVDGLFTLATDPLNWVAPGAGTVYRKGAGVIGQAGRGSARNPSAIGKLAGLVDDKRPQVVEEQARAWLDSHTGRQLTEWMAGNDRFVDIWEATKGKLGAQTTEALRAAPDAGQVRQILDRALTSGQVREFPTAPPSTLGLSVRHRTDKVRFLQMVPGRAVDSEHLDDAAEQLLRSARNAKLGDDEIEDTLRRVGSLQEGDRVGLFDVVKTHYADINRKIMGRGLTKAEANKIAGKVFEGAGDDARAYYVNLLGENADFPGARTSILQGREIVQPTAHIPSEMLNRAIPLPDAREVRRATSGLAKILAKRDDPKMAKVVRLAIDTAAATQSNIITPLWLLRAKWLVRVSIDQQARMAFAGLDSIYNHPFAWISTALGTPQGRLSQFAAKTLRTEGRLAKGLDGEALDLLTEFQQAVGNQQNYMLHRGQVPIGPRSLQRVMHPSANPDNYDRYVKGMANELSTYASDPAMRAAATLTEDELLEWFSVGAGRQVREQLALSGRGRMLSAQEQAVYGVQGTVEDALLGSRRFADDYARSFRQRLLERTGANAEVIDAIASGRAGDVDVAALKDLSTPEGRKFISWLGDRVDRLPAWAKASQLDTPEGFAAVRSQWDQAVSWMFQTLFAKPDSFLSRSPAYRQFYWQGAADLIPHMDAPTRELFFTRAAEAGLGRREMRFAREQAAKFNPGDAITDIDTAANLAKKYALDATQELLYQTSSKHQFSDILRITNPFIEPIVEAMTIWPRKMAANPLYTRRAAHVINGARGSGFITQDPVSGEDVINYPSPLLAKALGLPEDIDARLSGGAENLFSFNAPLALATGQSVPKTAVLPGFGPVVQIPAARYLPDKPEWDWARDILFPYGAPPEGPLSQQAAEAAGPMWFKRLQTWMQEDPAGNRTWDNSVLEMMQALAASGDYSNASGGLDVERLEDDAKQRAKRLMLVKAVAQFVLPTGEAVRYQVKDPSGQAHELRALAVELRKLQQELGYNEGTESFIDEFGTDLGAAVQGKSAALEERSMTKRGLDFERDHPDLVKKYGDVIGFFNPIGPDQPFDLKAWARQIDDTRNPKTPEEYAKLYNAYLGNLLWDQAKSKLIDAEGGMRSDAAAVTWLTAVREALVKEYPGFQSTIVGQGKTLNPDEKITMLETAVKDPRLAGTDAGQGLELYLMARAKANATVASNPEAYNGAKDAMNAKSTKYLRDWLRLVAEAIVQEHPEFAPMWERVLSREMTERDELIPQAEQPTLVGANG
jgi:hypothetical protein